MARTSTAPRQRSWLRRKMLDPRSCATSVRSGFQLGVGQGGQLTVPFPQTTSSTRKRTSGSRSASTTLAEPRLRSRPSTWPDGESAVQELTPTKLARICQGIFLKLYQNGWLEEHENKQLYCEKDDRFLADRYVEGTCPKCLSEVRGPSFPLIRLDFSDRSLEPFRAPEGTSASRVRPRTSRHSSS